jgi:hypothetical protein
MTQTRDGLAAKRLRRASVLIILSLAVQGFSLVWRHPLAFVAFLLVGGLLLLIGLGIYVWVLLYPAPASSGASGDKRG